MEPNGTNDNRVPTVVLCKSGCGFYGSLACEGLCSKCYTDLVKSRHENSRAEKMGEQTEPSGSSRNSEAKHQQNHSTEGICEALRRASVSDVSTDNLSSQGAAAACSLSATAAAESLACASLSSTATAAAVPSSVAVAADSLSSAAATELPPEAALPPSEQKSGISLGDDEPNVSADTKSKKKNRCHTCNKKVGLTGFPCRCGGLYCSMHRYSDTHSCTFNYKVQAQEDIRKNNPVVVGEKIRKI